MRLRSIESGTDENCHCFVYQRDTFANRQLPLNFEICFDQKGLIDVIFVK